VVTPEFLGAGRYQVNVGGHRFPATVSLRAPFDPAGTRVRDA
jgi:4-methylaminobutanoate oxidase (formaldehyde-forming)